MSLFLLSAGWVVGLALSPHTPFHSSHWLLLAGLCLLAILLSRDSRNARLLFGFILALCLAAARGQHFQQNLQPGLLAKFNDLPHSVQINGVIHGYPEERDGHTAFILRAESIQIDNGPITTVDSRLLARADRLTDWAYGDRVALVGRLETPPEFEDFSYRAYLARQGIFSLLRVERADILERNAANPLLAAIYTVRARAHRVIGQIFPEPEASLLSGILLGLEAGINTEVREAFNRTGTTHIIAISGFNITIVASLFIGLGKRWLGALPGALIAAAAILIYTILVGADAAVLRATVMAFLALLAQRLGRRTDGLAALGATAIIMTALNPAILADVGFQLSFAATLGLILYSEPLTEAFIRRLEALLRLDETSNTRWSGPISEYFTATLAAQITTLPLILFHFQRLSVIAPLANLLILPAQPAVMVLSGLATLAGMLWLPFGQALGWLAWPFAKFTIDVVGWLAQAPLASLPTAPVSLGLVVTFYALLALLTFRNHLGIRAQPMGAAPQLPWPALIIFLLVANFVLWRTVFSQPDGQLHLTLLKSGAQASLLLESPQGRQLLINGGASSIQLGSQLDARLSPLQRQIDWIILTQSTEETAAGVAGLIDRYSVGGALVVNPTASSAYRTIADTLSAASRPVGPLSDGQELNLGDGAWLKLRQLEAGALFTLEYRRARFLLVTGQPEAWLGFIDPASAQSGSVLLLPASGDASLSPPDQVMALQPGIIMLAVDPAEARGLPPRSLLDAAADRTLLRTDQDGWINLRSDGVHLWVRTERQQEQAGLSQGWPLESPPAFFALLGLN